MRKLLRTVSKNSLPSREDGRIRKETSVLSNRKMERLSARWSAMIAWLENTPIGNSPNCTGRYASMSTVFSLR